ncbi:MAG: hypothetical protein ABI474_09405 [Actinomycetota bacterium]
MARESTGEQIMSEARRNTPQRDSGKAMPPSGKRDRQSRHPPGSGEAGVATPRFFADAPRQPKTLDAWKIFVCQLSAALRGLEEDECLVLSHKQRNRYVQFVNQGSAGFRAETVSDFYLPDEDRLSDDDCAYLLQLGWEAPTNLPDEFGFRPDGSPNFFLDLANPVSLEELAALAVTTLVNVHRAQHPNALQYSTGGGSNGSIRFPNLGIRQATGD